MIRIKQVIIIEISNILSSRSPNSCIASGRYAKVAGMAQENNSFRFCKAPYPLTNIRSTVINDNNLKALKSLQEDTLDCAAKQYCPIVSWQYHRYNGVARLRCL